MLCFLGGCGIYSVYQLDTESLILPSSGMRLLVYKNMPRIDVTCKECGKITKDYLCNGRQFCSKGCKIVSAEVLKKLSKTWFKEGHKTYHPFKKGNTFWKMVDPVVHKSKMERGEDRYNWKGDSVGYGGLHNWVKLYLGKPETCEHCGKTGLKGKKIHWANKSQEYRRELTDWLRLCVPCHSRYDRKII